jgi:hypothetical protein
MLRWLTVLGLLAAPASSLAAGQWADEQQLGVYSFHSEFPLRDIERLVEELGDLQKDIECTLDLRCAERPIHVYLFRSRSGYLQAVKRHVPAGSRFQAMFIAGNDFGRVYACRGLELDTDLRHETTHALLHNALPYVPLWLDEGLAEYFEVPVGQRVDRHSHRSSLRWAIRFGNWRADLAQLEAKHELKTMSGSDYRDAWGWVHFMLHGPPEARAALEQFLETIPTGREPTPLSISLQRRLPDLDKRVVQHLR